MDNNTSSKESSKPNNGNQVLSFAGKSIPLKTKARGNPGESATHNDSREISNFGNVPGMDNSRENKISDYSIS